MFSADVHFWKHGHIGEMVVDQEVSIDPSIDALLILEQVRGWTRSSWRGH
jgi:hypothetical protein